MVPLQPGLAAQRGQQRVRALFLDYALDKLGSDGLDIGAVGQARVGHDGRRVGVDQDDLKAILLEHLAGLGAGVVKLTGLANDNGARANDEDTAARPSMRPMGILCDGKERQP